MGQWCASEEGKKRQLLAGDERCVAGRQGGSWWSLSDWARRGRGVGSWRRGQTRRGRTSG